MESNISSLCPVEHRSRLLRSRSSDRASLRVEGSIAVRIVCRRTGLPELYGYVSERARTSVLVFTGVINSNCYLVFNL